MSKNKKPAMWYHLRNMLKAYIQVNDVHCRGNQTQAKERDKKLRSMLQELENPTPPKT